MGRGARREVGVATWSLALALGSGSMAAHAEPAPPAEPREPRVEPASSVEPASPVEPAEPHANDVDSEAADDSSPDEEADEEPRPLVFHPEAPSFGQTRWALGLFYDAIDPQAVYGMTTRVPQVQLDARFGLGQGWSWLAHCNTLLVVNELTTGPAYTLSSGPLSLQLSLPLGAYLGFLEGFGFASSYAMALARPALTLGYRADELAASLRGELILSSREFVSVGGVSAPLDDNGPLTGYMLSFVLENRLANDSAWYLGLAWAVTRASYQLWLLFPDSQGLYSYPRISVGYEF